MKQAALATPLKRQVGRESRKRSVVKSLIWRVIATTVTILLAYAWFGEWGSSISLGLAANAIKTVLYYLHERLWDRVEFGRKKEAPEDYTI